MFKLVINNIKWQDQVSCLKHSVVVFSWQGVDTSKVQGPLEEVIDLFFFNFSLLRLALQPTQEWPALLLIVQMLLRFVMTVAKKKVHT